MSYTAFGEYTQDYSEGPESIGEAPLGLAPPGPDLPGIVPRGLRRIPASGGANTGTSLAPRVTGGGGGQYVQRYDESVTTTTAALVPGLRGSARRLFHFPDPLIEGTYGPILEANGGYPYNYYPNKVRSYTPSREFQSVFVNGKAVPAKRFRAQAVQEINSNKCT